MPETTVLVLLAVALVVALELVALRTGIFRSARYWITVLVLLAAQVAVDGWVARGGVPLIGYAADELSGVRLSSGVPIESVGGWLALLTGVLTLWRWQLTRTTIPAAPSPGPPLAPPATAAAPADHPDRATSGSAAGPVTSSQEDLR